MIETDLNKRQEAVLEVETKRDKIVTDVLAERNVTVISGRKTLPLAGWDAQYIVEYEGRRVVVVDRALVPLEELASNIRGQLDR